MIRSLFIANLSSLLLLVGTLTAGSITGVIQDKDTHESLMSANVLIVDTPYGAPSNADGKYSISGIPQGRYTLRVTMLGYESRTTTNVAILTDGITAMDFELKPTALNLQEMEVVTGANKGTKARELQDRFNKTAITEGLSAETMKALPDPDIAKVVTRTTGVSTMGGDPIIRGLGVRYSKVTLNGAQLSGTEPNRSAVSLELFPAALMQQVTVSKSFLPDQFGEFGGGNIDMNTWQYRGSGLKPELTVSVSSSINSRSTFKDFQTYQGGKLDFLGFDDGTRALPWAVDHASIKLGSTTMPTHEIQYYSESFSNHWALQPVTARPNQSYSVTLQDRLPLLGHDFSVLASGLYRNGMTNREFDENTYAISGSTLDPKTIYHGHDFSNSVTMGGIGSARWQVSPLTTLSYNVMFNRQAEDQVRTYQGYKSDQDTQGKTTRLQFVGETIVTNQLIGEHAFPSLLKSNLKWQVSYARGLRNEPDTRQVTYYLQDTTWAMNLNLDNCGTRIFNNLQDNTWNVGADWSLRPSLLKNNLNLKFGAAYVHRDRDASSRYFEYVPGLAFNYSLSTLPPEQLFVPPYLDPSILYLADRTASTDDYTAKQNILGLYWMVDLPLTAKLQFTGGVRVEQCDQVVTSFEPFDPNLQPFEGKFFTTDILPAVTLVYTLDPATKIRLAASQTVSRPDFREMSKFEYQEYDGGYNYIGNPDLERALVRNFDLRTERLWDGINLASISLFYKYFVHPIEVANYSSSGKEISYFNADNAYNYGVELELRQSLGTLWHHLRKFSFSGNLTLLQSHVNLNNTIEGLNTLQNRPMQGQSPYLLNLDLGYLHPNHGTRCDLLLNVFGKRIQTVGAQDVPTIYELPHPNLDFTFQQRLFTGLDLKGSAENLLDQEYLLQFGVPGQFYQYRYYQGRSYSLGLSYHL